jgi:phage terminase large subunit
MAKKRDVELKVDVKIPNVYKELFDWVLNRRKEIRFIYLTGGRGSGKSWAMAMLIVLLMMTRKGFRVVVAREYFSDTGDSARRLILDVISLLGQGLYIGEEEIYRGLFDIKERSITCISTGATLVFLGLNKDQARGVKSIEGVDFVWVEEAVKLNKTSQETLIPTIRKEGSIIGYSFNPDLDEDPVYVRMLEDLEDEETRKVTFHRHTTYLDCLDFLSPTIIKEAQRLERRNQEDYIHTYLGKTRSYSDLHILADKIHVAEFHTPADVKLYGGVDWGFSQDPLVALTCFIKDDTLFVNRCMQKVGVELKDLDLFIGNVIPKTIRAYADASSPALINDMQSKGFSKLKKAKPYAGSIKDGINFLRGFDRIVFHKYDCDLDSVLEIKNLKWKQNKVTKQILTEPASGFDHVSDALRYALTEYIMPNKKRDLMLKMLSNPMEITS